MTGLEAILESTSIDVQRIAEDLYSFQVPNLHGRSGQATNVYIVGRQPVTLIDTGSDDGGATVTAALEQLGISQVSSILLTHAHHDHSGSCRALRAATGATVLLHERDLDAPHVTIEPDGYLHDSQTVNAPPYSLQVVETPGHAPGHVSFYEPHLKALFSGDLMSGFGSVAVIPPRGSMAEYLSSLRRVQQLEVATVYPGHGPVIENGAERIREYIEHRERRETEILALITEGVGSVSALTEILYPDVLPRIRPLAAGTVMAHIIRLLDDSRIKIDQEEPELADSRFVAASPCRNAVQGTKSGRGQRS